MVDYIIIKHYVHLTVCVCAQVQRTEVPDNKVEWSETFEGYTPSLFTAPHILAKPVYADPEIGYKH